MTVAISTDDFNAIKGKTSLIPYEERAAIVEALKIVEEVIPEDSWDQKINDIKNHDIDIFVIGDDWQGEFDFLSEYCEVIYLSRTPGISSTQIKGSLK